MADSNQYTGNPKPSYDILYEYFNQLNDVQTQVQTHMQCVKKMLRTLLVFFLLHHYFPVLVEKQKPGEN